MKLPVVLGKQHQAVVCWNLRDDRPAQQAFVFAVLPPPLPVNRQRRAEARRDDEQQQSDAGRHQIADHREENVLIWSFSYCGIVIQSHLVPNAKVTRCPNA
jgi:hypothetical protein